MIAAERSLLIDQFHTLYYDSREQTWGNTFWLGHHVLKCPLDLWIYQEILHELRPALVVETGTYLGGSAYFLASICDLLDGGEIITVDAARQPNLPQHPRITYLNGTSTPSEILRHRLDSGSACSFVTLEHDELSRALQRDDLVRFQSPLARWTNDRAHTPLQDRQGIEGRRGIPSVHGVECRQQQG